MNCARCDCPEKGHCKGGQVHFHSKGDRHESTVCVSRHCNSPLCSCVDYIKPEAEDKQ